MEKIGTQNGIESARRHEDRLHPDWIDPVDGKTKPISAWDTRSHTLQLLIGNTNQLIDAKRSHDLALALVNQRLTALESQPTTPFPLESGR